MALILLVDDDFLSLEFMKVFLEGEGHTVMVASTSGEAAAAVTDKKPEILMTDIRLSDGSGIDLAKRAKTSGIARIFGVTGLDPEVLAENGDNKFFDAIIPKPVDFDLIAKHLKDYASRASREGE